MRLRPGRLTFAGRLGSAHAHAHAAVQVLVVSAGEVLLTDAHDETRAVRAAVIGAGARHTLHAPDAEGVMVYLDPAGRDARALAASLDRSDTVASWVTAAQPVEDLLAGRTPSVAAGDQAVETLAGLPEPPRPASAAVVRALELLPELTGGPIRLDQVAAAVGLSPSRLRHLFVQQAGLPFSACVRWARLHAAMDVVRAGGSLTEAAHTAGFSDSAHLTRVCHAMLGLAPSTALRHLHWQ
ncbi:helix-turn-helix transcriptional regulator [Actinomadura hibisca]|uniref:helix-turn-helix transcriptional regulator n=1 Tax=Actinomadura hibisca TaxID=68565 RepID=UPI000B10CEE6|nr:AraC family transcriptional regulator [Actinomadura hibisca]